VGCSTRDEYRKVLTYFDFQELRTETIYIVLIRSRLAPHNGKKFATDGSYKRSRFCGRMVCEFEFSIHFLLSCAFQAKCY
jgi:hypothetical protein